METFSYGLCFRFFVWAESNGFFLGGGGGGLPSGLNDFSGVCFNFVGLFRSKNLTSFTPLCH